MVVKRCIWANSNPLYVEYHDEEWGLPIRGDDQKLFEVLALEQMQDGLSRLMVLQKRENFRKAFDDFDPEKVARYTDRDVDRLMSDRGIIRHRPKINAIVVNARALLEVQEAIGSFDAYVWSFVSGEPIQNAWHTLSEIPTTTEEATAMSRDLLKRNFRRVSPKICYAYMQSVGMVNDHTVDCFRHKEVAKSRA